MDYAAEYAAAVERESQLREAVFLGLPETVGGYELRPLTTLDYTTMHLVRSPFIVGGTISKADIWQFLWFQSVKFSPTSIIRRRLFMWKIILNNRQLELLTGVRGFISETLFDLPGNGKSSKAFYSFIASVVDLLASEYGWTRDSIIKIPLKEIAQYLKAIRLRKDSKAILFNPSDPLYLKAMRQRMEAVNGN